MHFFFQRPIQIIEYLLNHQTIAKCQWLMLQIAFSVAIKIIIAYS